MEGVYCSMFFGSAGISPEKFNLNKFKKSFDSHSFRISQYNNGLLIGTQMASLCINEEHYTILCNGTIYNRADVIAELLSHGCCLSQPPDAEIFLNAYSKWKESFVEHINGVFAVAIVAHESNQVFLARDRAGVKSLFYKITQDGLLFSTDMKLLLYAPDARAELTQQGVYELIMLGPGRIPGSGILNGISAIAPGTFGCYENRKLTLTNYWRLWDHDHVDTFEQTVDKIRYLVIDSILKQFSGSDNCGTMLSGGLDSSIIAAVCSKYKSDVSESIKTYSVRYEHQDQYFIPGKFLPERDGHYIDKMINELQTEHHDCSLCAAELYDHLNDSVIARSFPGMADIDSSLLLFCRSIRKTTSTILSGECADEIFGGYPWYHNSEIMDETEFPWARNTLFRSHLLRNNQKEALDFAKDAYQKACRSCDLLQDSPDHDKKKMTYLNFYWFMQTLLERSEKMGAQADLEIRVPFCDYRIAEYLYGIPWIYKNYGGREKGLLRYAMQDLLPENILYRKKSPFPKTFDPNYTCMITMASERLLKKDTPIWEFISKEYVENLIHQNITEHWYGQLMQKPQILAYLLQVDFWLRHCDIQLKF